MPNHYEFYELKLEKWPQIKLPVANAALRAIKETLALLEQPNVWVKGDYELLNSSVIMVADDPCSDVVVPWRGCLIGAVQKIDGEGELLAASILTSVITGEIYLDEDLVPSERQRHRVWDSDNDDDYHFFDGSDDASKVEVFNDDNDTTFADIKKFLEFSIGQAERVVAHAANGLGFVVESV